MNRGITNMIRFVMDEGLPPFIRDRRWFMYLFFKYWFKGKNTRLYMDFKKLAWQMSDEEFAKVYRELDCRATDRPTDLNRSSIDFMLSKLDPISGNLLDVGCGRGYWLNLLKEKKQLALHGCDLFDQSPIVGINYSEGNAEKLPFADKSFDIVTCHHTIEHLRQPALAINELKRVARKQVIIVTPKQRYYYYTLDLHLNFFFVEEDLTRLTDERNYECRNCNGDWCYIINL